MQAEKIKIVYLINGLGVGGAEMMLYRLLEQLDRNKFQPEVVALLKFSSLLQAKIEALGVEVHIIGIRSKFDLGSLFRLNNLLKELSPEILHTQLFAADIMGRIVGRKLKIPVIITSIRNAYYGGYGRYFFFKITERFADATTFVSKAALNYFVDQRVLPVYKASLIYNGLNPDFFYSGLGTEEKNTFRYELSLPENEYIILAVGSLTRQKGYKYLLEAVNILFQKNKRFILLIAGSGSLKNDLVSVVKGYGLEKKVIFLGRSDQVPELMAAVDLLVLASLWEGLPGVVLEAMASELPVVATAAGGTPELVVEGKTGYLIQPGNPEELASGIEKVLSLSDEERLALGLAGRLRVEEHFSLSKMVSAYENLYYELLKEKGIS